MGALILGWQGWVHVFWGHNLALGGSEMGGAWGGNGCHGTSSRACASDVCLARRNVGLGGGGLAPSVYLEARSALGRPRVGRLQLFLKLPSPLRPLPLLSAPTGHHAAWGCAMRQGANPWENYRKA